MENPSERHLAAQLAELLYAKKITYKELLDDFPSDSTDEEIAQLLSLIEHEPKVGGLFGVSENEHALYLEEIRNLINRLQH